MPLFGGNQVFLLKTKKGKDKKNKKKQKKT